MLTLLELHYKIKKAIDEYGPDHGVQVESENSIFRFDAVGAELTNADPEHPTATGLAFVITVADS